jgi:hypothetical protein
VAIERSLAGKGFQPWLEYSPTLPTIAVKACWWVARTKYWFKNKYLNTFGESQRFYKE